MGRNSVKRQYKRQSKRKQNRGKKTKSRMAARQRGGGGGGSDAGSYDGRRASDAKKDTHQCRGTILKHEGKLAYLYCEVCDAKRRDTKNDEK